MVVIPNFFDCKGVIMPRITGRLHLVSGGFAPAEQGLKFQSSSGAICFCRFWYGIMITNTILVADDEKALRVILAEALTDKGFDVIQAADGSEAIQLLQATPSISILLTDIRMPQMDGFSLAEAAVAANPELKVLMMTGYAEERIPEGVLKAREVRLLFKPIAIDDLCDRISDMTSRA